MRLAMKLDGVLIRGGEIYLKGRNLRLFENALVKAVKGCGKDVVVERKHRRIIAIGADMEKLRCVFGITSFSPVKAVDAKIGAITNAALEMAGGFGGKTFKVDCRRPNKGFSMDSMGVNFAVGEAVCRKTGMGVDLTDPEIVLGIEIHERAYIYYERIAGAGGMPVGSQGRVIGLIEDKLSVLACLLAMRRGCEVIPWGQDPGVDLAVLRKYGCRNEIVVCGEEDIDGVAERLNARAVITGEMLGTIKRRASMMLYLKPLVGYDTREAFERLEGFLRW